MITAAFLVIKKKKGFLLNFWMSCDVFELQRGILLTSGRTATPISLNNKGKLLTQIIQREKMDPASGIRAQVLWSLRCSSRSISPFTVHISSILSGSRRSCTMSTSMSRFMPSQLSNPSEKRAYSMHLHISSLGH